VNELATDTQWAISMLDEAAAILEAEWIRLQQAQGVSERELTRLFADLSAPRYCGQPTAGDDRSGSFRQAHPYLKATV
jgi:hypothetical protein